MIHHLMLLTTKPEVAPAKVEEPHFESLHDSRLYINRELSLLSFQWRVLEEAQDESSPLLERFKFLSKSFPPRKHLELRAAIKLKT